MTSLNVIIQVLIKIWFICHNVLNMSDIMTFLQNRFFVNMKHFHVFYGLFEELNPIFVIWVYVDWLGESVGAYVDVCFMFAHLNFLLRASLKNFLFLFRGTVILTSWTFWSGIVFFVWRRSRLLCFRRFWKRVFL